VLMMNSTHLALSCEQLCCSAKAKVVAASFIIFSMVSLDLLASIL
jgi:hypothetical protein